MGYVDIEPVVTLVVLSIVLMIGLHWLLPGPDPTVENTARTYLRALATGDVVAAREVSTGRAADAASRLEGKDLAAQVVDMKVEVEAYSDSWARVLATVELALKDGSPDVGWYELELVRDGGVWKAYSLREVPPAMKGNVNGLPKWVRQLPLFGDSAGEKELREAEAVFRGYLDDLAAGRYKEAARWLAGPALKKHLDSMELLEKGRIIEQVSNLVLTPLGSGDKVMLAEAGYRADEKDVWVIVTFYHTALGWRIVVIS